MGSNGLVTIGLEWWWFVSERTTQSTIYFESALHEALTSKADAAGGSISELVNSAIRLLLIEDQQDLAVFEERTDEETVPHENFLNHLETTDLLQTFYLTVR